MAIVPCLLFSKGNQGFCLQEINQEMTEIACYKLFTSIKSPENSIIQGLQIISGIKVWLIF
jgi:hypothetical protein